MKKAYAVIGANFGDEGKGLMTDYFCRKGGGKVLNIRFNGGAQAGHTVVTSDGRRHVFSHIGAGALAGADTYLPEFFTVNPMLFMREYGQLPLRANVAVSEKAAVSLPCDMLINRFAERSRGAGRHGSCGVGIYETVLRSRESSMKISFGDVSDTEKSRRELLCKISEINESYVPKRLADLGFGEIPHELSELLRNENLSENFVDDLMMMKKICRTADSAVFEEYDTAVFEGAQGLLLDCGREDYFPHLTPSHTGMTNVRRLLGELSPAETEVCYVTRSYFTRHGAGRFNTEIEELRGRYGLHDKTNAPNEFQGNFRYGFFDAAEFSRSLELDRKFVMDCDRVSVCVTHLDETSGNVVCPGGTAAPQDIARMVGAEGCYTSFGETAECVKAVHID